MNGRRAKALKRKVREQLAMIPPWQAGGIQTGIYNGTFVRGGQRRAYQNAKTLYRKGVSI